MEDTRGAGRRGQDDLLGRVLGVSGVLPRRQPQERHKCFAGAKQKVEWYGLVGEAGRYRKE